MKILAPVKRVVDNDVKLGEAPSASPASQALSPVIRATRRA